jgi:hypothetical protein
LRKTSTNFVQRLHRPWPQQRRQPRLQRQHTVRQRNCEALANGTPHLCAFVCVHMCVVGVRSRLFLPVHVSAGTHHLTRRPWT